MLLYNTSLDRQIIAECNHIKIFFYNLNSLLTINILQKWFNMDSYGKSRGVAKTFVHLLYTYV